jgi:hypothetical protein
MFAFDELGSHFRLRTGRPLERRLGRPHVSPRRRARNRLWPNAVGHPLRRPRLLAATPKPVPMAPFNAPRAGNALPLSECVLSEPFNNFRPEPRPSRTIRVFSV